MGVAIIKAMAGPVGMPFFNKPSGDRYNCAHSQTGKTNPINEVNTRVAENYFFGKILKIISSETNTCISDDMIVPNNTNGSASKRIDQRISVNPRMLASVEVSTSPVPPQKAIQNITAMIKSNIMPLCMFSLEVNFRTGRIPINYHSIFSIILTFLSIRIKSLHLRLNIGDYLGVTMLSQFPQNNFRDNRIVHDPAVAPYLLPACFVR